MANTIIRLTIAAAAAAALGGCASQTPNLDAHFGESVRTARALQTVNPDASRNTDPVAGIDGRAGRDAMGRYHDSFKAPPPTFGVINIGGSFAGGEGK